MQDLVQGRNLGSEREAHVVADLPELPNISQVEVPALPCPLSQERLQLLRAHIDPLQEDSTMGMDTFTATLRFLHDQ